MIDHRPGDPDISLPDALMSAFAMFSLKSPSLLAFDQERTAGNLHRVMALSGCPAIPRCAKSSIRSILRPCAHSSRMCFEPFVVPLMPEPIIKQDGTNNNDCERNAAKQLVVKLRQDHPPLQLIVSEDSLSSNAPHIHVLHDHNLHDMLGVKEGDHAFLFEHVEAAEHAGRLTYDDRLDHATGIQHRFRFVSDVPLNASNPDLRVNFLECWEVGPGPGYGPTL